MQVFIVRPFGSQSNVDFDAVERLLIQPALDELGLKGGTTGEFAQAGNIRADMIQELLVAELVVADISIHNANVYYELGVRHALRDRATVLIRCASAPVPFDLRTDRYLEYSASEPAATRESLKLTIKATLAGNKSDSPVFQLLPHLKPHDLATLVPLPREFREAVDLAADEGDSGQLALMAQEVHAQPWRIQARRLIADKLFLLKSSKAAVVAYEEVRRERPDDAQANLHLATLYQRLGDLARSDLAIARVTSRPNVSVEDRREASALLARNEKVRWFATWADLKTLPERQRAALRSPFLDASLKAYHDGFRLDPRSFYAGLNALALAVVQEQLALAHPDVWSDFQCSDDAAASKLKELGRVRERLTHAVAFALEAANVNQREDDGPWVGMTKAGHALLSGTPAKRVCLAYERARQELQAGGFQCEADARQLTLYRELGLFGDATTSALEAIGFPDGVALKCNTEPPVGLVIVGTGHRIDPPGRAPRFPVEGQDAAREALRREIENVKVGVVGSVRGMAALASGSDILFHEVCAELQVPTEVLLPLPADLFKAESVSDGGSDWSRRFDELCRKLKVRVLSDSNLPPSWTNDEHYSAFQRGNLWLLDSAFAVAHSNVALIALWNREPSEGQGGTGDMVKSARERGADVRIIDTNELFGIG